MTDQLIIGSKASFDDFFASVAKRTIGMPKKKSIKETVPYSNETYDFSAINGELYWEERELEYVFEIIAPTPEKLEELKTAFATWVMNVQGEELHDPFIPDYHFKATYNDMDFDDEEGLEKTTATVTFTAYPYKIANYPTVYEGREVSPETLRIGVNNPSGHPVKAVLSLTYEDGNYDGKRVGIGLNDKLWTMDAVDAVNRELVLPTGTSTLLFHSVLETYGAYTVKLTFTEEVF